MFYFEAQSIELIQNRHCRIGDTIKTRLHVTYYTNIMNDRLYSHIYLIYIWKIYLHYRCWKWNKIRRWIFNVAQRWYNVSAQRWNNVKTMLCNVRTMLHNVGKTLIQRCFNLASTLVKAILNPIELVMIMHLEIHE